VKILNDGKEKSKIKSKKSKVKRSLHYHF